MTAAERVVEALLAADVDALRVLAQDPSVGEVARAGLARLAPDDLLTDDERAVLRTISGHPGLSAAELAERVGPAFAAVARQLVERGLVTSSRFGRTDCWSRTAAGAAALARRE